MDWLWIVKQPWFDVSPNALSISWYVLCGILGARILLAKGIHYKRWQKLIAFTDGIFLIGIIVVIQDSFWLLFNTVKWFAQYGNQMSFSGYWIRFPQNLVGLCFLLLCTYGVWKAKFVSVTRVTIFWMVCVMLLMTSIFIFAPDPSWTDYTYAVRVLAPDWQISLEFMAFLFTKFMLTLSFLGLFREPRIEITELQDT